MCVLQHTFYKMHQVMWRLIGLVGFIRMILSPKTAAESNELNITLSPPTMQDNNFSRPPPGTPSCWFMIAINLSINCRPGRN